jgi:serine/threonine protein kinase
MATSVPVPKEWPADVSKEYEPVRVLGVGGFASVTLARKKNAKEGDDKLVAIKIAGSKDSTRKDVAYAHREIDILKEIDHKNIMKLITYWEPSPKEHLCAAVIALSYHKVRFVH